MLEPPGSDRSVLDPRSSDLPDGRDIEPGPHSHDEASDSSVSRDGASVPHVDGDRGETKSSSAVLGFLAEIPGLMLVAFLLAILLKTFLLQAFYIPSESMLPTLEINDRVLVNKLSYRFGDPGRGDVAVFTDPGSVGKTGLAGLWDSLTSGFGLTKPGEEDFIKRIIGLPGETLEIRQGVIYIDDQPIPESLATEGGYLGGPSEEFGPTTVPEGHYFVMGDNRQFSADSRTLLGTIPADHLVGRAFVLIWPVDRAKLLTPPEYDVSSVTLLQPAGGKLVPA